MDFSGFSWGEVITASLAALVLHFIWFGPLFGSQWKKLNSVEQKNIGLVKTSFNYAVILLLILFTATMMSFFMEIAMMLYSGAVSGALFGGFLAVTFVLPAFTINYIVTGNSLLLFFINAGYWLLQFALMGAIMGAMQ